MKRRRLLLWAAIATPAIGWATLAVGGAQQWLKKPLERHASAALGRAVSIGGGLRVIVTPSSIYLNADDVRIANPDWARSADLLHVESLKARFSTFDLLIGRAGPRAVSVAGGTLALERAPEGGAVNWALGDAGGWIDPATVRQIDADDLLVRYDDPAAHVAARLALTSGGSGIVSVTGRGTAADRPFALGATISSADEHPTQFTVSAQSSGMKLTLAGEGEGPFQLSPSGMRATAQGEDFAALAALAGMDIPAMPAFAFQAQLGHRRGGWHFSRIEGRIGSTDLSGKLTLDRRGERPRVVAELASQMLQLGDGMTLLGLRTDSAPQNIEANWSDLPIHAGRTRLLPDASLSTEALGGFDAVIAYTAQQIGGTRHALSHLDMRLALVEGRLMVSPASVDFGGGFVSSDVFIDARRGPALARYDVRLSPTPMGSLLAGWGIAPGESTAMARGRIQLSGRGDTLRETLGNADGRIALVLPAGSVRMQRASMSELDMAHLQEAMFGENEPADLNCGLIAFTVRQGVATSDPILIDTDGHVLSGSGRLDLGSERLDLRLEADGKHRAWFGRPAPLLIGGTLADPMVLREPVALFRPTRLLGLNMMLPDFGAIFGFVDADKAQAPACGPLLRDGSVPDELERPQEFAALR